MPTATTLDAQTRQPAHDDPVRSELMPVGQCSGATSTTATERRSHRALTPPYPRRPPGWKGGSATAAAEKG